MRLILSFVRLLAYVTFGVVLGFTLAAFVFNHYTGCPTILWKM